MTLAKPKDVPAAERVCRCPESLLQTRAASKWATEQFCERCGRLARLRFHR